MVHGTEDPVIPIQLADASRAALQARGYRVDWHTYPMPHSVCAEELEAIAGFLVEAFGDAVEGTARRSSILLP
jgi:phospholipase/carboxylesterase